MRIWFSDSRRVCALTLEGEYVVVGKYDLRESMLKACDAERIVLVDFGGVTFIDSSAVGIIVGAHKRCTSAGKQLLLVNVRGAPLRVLRMLGLQHLYSAPMAPRDVASDRTLKRV